jgi:hypothetical protein
VLGVYRNIWIIDISPWIFRLDVPKAMVAIAPFGLILVLRAVRATRLASTAARQGITSGHHVGRQWVAVALFAVTTLTPIGAWGVRNLITHDTFTIGSVGRGVVLWMGNREQATGGIMGPSRPENYEEVARTFQSDTSILRENRIFTEIALREIVQNPSRVFYLALVKLDRFWWTLYPERIAERLEARTTAFTGGLVNPLLVRALSMLGHAVATTFAVYGFVTLVRGEQDRAQRAGALALFVLIFCMTHMPFLAEPRYRIPVVPLIDILSVVGFVRFIDRTVAGQSDTQTGEAVSSLRYVA